MERYIPSIEMAMREALDKTEAATADLFADRDLSLYGMLRYHLGWANPDFSAADSDGGKRIRPLVCVLACLAAGGDAEAAVPTAAAIELLHNFTLIHDDVQDRSLTRRHRRTVWSLYGEGQAINAGDAMFAISQLPLLGSSDGSKAIPPETVIRLSRAFNETVLRIVEGQVLDLGFEDRWDITAADYQRMIRGKTATLVSFSAWAGSTIAGVDDVRAGKFAAFGQALGLGFQVRDDLLGIWGEPDVTGKPAADDIRRRKKSLPIVMLASEAVPADRELLLNLYQQPELDAGDVETILSLLRRYEVDDRVQQEVERYHVEARQLLDEAAGQGTAHDALLSLAERLATRAF